MWIKEGGWGGDGVAVVLVSVFGRRGQDGLLEWLVSLRGIQMTYEELGRVEEHEIGTWDCGRVHVLSRSWSRCTPESNRVSIMLVQYRITHMALIVHRGTPTPGLFTEGECAPLYSDSQSHPCAFRQTLSALRLQHQASLWWVLPWA